MLYDVVRRRTTSSYVVLRRTTSYDAVRRRTTTYDVVLGLKKSDLVLNKTGKVVSKKMSQRMKNSPWLKAVKQARSALKIKGFCAIKKGSELYKKAKELYGK